MERKKPDLIPFRVNRLIMGSLVILIVGIGTWLALEVRSREDKSIRSELLRQASNVAATLSLENVRDLTFRAEDSGRLRIGRERRKRTHHVDLLAELGPFEAERPKERFVLVERCRAVGGEHDAIRKQEILACHLPLARLASQRIEAA